MRHVLPLSGFLLCGLLLTACSGGARGPAMPAPDVPAAPAGQLSPAFIPTAVTSDLTAGFGTFGTLGGTLNLETLEVELDPLPRRTQLGETFDLDITDFTNENPCPDCMQISGIGLTGNGTINVAVSMRHPFKTTTFFQTRPDLNVFDVRVIAILAGTDQSNSILTIPDNSTTPTSTIGNFGAVVNADGFTSHFDSRAEDTRYFNPAKSLSGNINAFKRYFVDPEKVDPFEPTNPDGWNVMPIASPIQTQIFEIDPAALIGGPTVSFVLVAEAAWGVARNLQLPVDDPGGRFNPKYWLPEFNQHEPWRVEVEVTDNNLRAGQGGSSISFTVRVADWQAGEVLDPAFPNLGNLRGLAVASDVARVRVAIPGVNNAGASQNTPSSGNGSAASPYVYSFTLANAEGAAGGDYWGLVAAEDQLNGSSAGPQRVPELGFPRQGAEIINYVGYQTFPVRVGDINFPPQVTVTMTPASGLLDAGQSAQFEAFVTDANPQDTHVIEWDFDYDATEGFEVQGTGVTIGRQFNIPGPFTVAVRVTDSGIPPQVTFLNNAAQVKVNGSVQPFRPFDAARFDRTPSAGGQAGFGFTSTGALLLAFSGLDNGEDVFISRTTNGINWADPGNLSLAAAGNQTTPVLTVAGQAALVVWEDAGAIVGAISTNGGVNWNTNIPIAPAGRLPAVASTSPAIFYVAYETAGDVFIEANVTGNLGDFTGPVTRLNDETDGLQSRPALAASPNTDRVYAAWEDEREPLFGIDIYGAIATGRATSISVNRALSDDRSNANDTQPALATGTSGDWVGLVYRSTRYRITGDILFQKSINQGVQFQPAVVLTAGPLASYSSPSIAVRNDVSAVLVAYTRATAPATQGVRYQVSTDGGSFFKPMVDAQAQAGVDPLPTVAMQPQVGENIVVAWTDTRNAASGVFGQVFIRLGYEFR